MIENQEAPIEPISESPPRLVGADEFEQGFGENLASTLDLSTWISGPDLHRLYGELERELHEAVSLEDGVRKAIRQIVFPLVGSAEGAPKCAGVRQATLDQISLVHRGLLFNGQVEAADGTSVVHDTLPLTIVQIAVALVSYQGDQGSWVHRLYRRDLRVGGRDPIEEAIAALNQRKTRDAYDIESPRDTLSSMARKGLMAYAERSVLLNKSRRKWLFGHGSAAPYELITGSGSRELLELSIPLLSELLGEHKRFVYVPSAPDRHLITIGNALNPLEYAIIDTIGPIVEKTAAGHYRGGEGAWQSLQKQVVSFAEDVGRKVVRGVYRASAMSPAQMFYAHEDYADEAALIAIADSALHEHRGFPMLIDLADTVCSSMFGSESLFAPVQAAYAAKGAAYQYAQERHTRKG